MKVRGQKVLAVIPLNLDGYLLRDGWTSGYCEQIHRRLAADFTAWETESGKFDREIENVIRALQADEGAREQPLEHTENLGRGSMENRTEPRTVGQWIRYIVVAVIAIWLVIWMLRIAGINIL